jgi:hypothetical protein
VILTPIRAPNATAHAERWVETVRAECLDWLLVRGRRHLDQVLRTYVDHYNRQSPHRALGLAAPLQDRCSGTRPSSRRSTTGPTRRPDPRVRRSRGRTNRRFRPPRGQRHPLSASADRA